MRALLAKLATPRVLSAVILMLAGILSGMFGIGVAMNAIHLALDGDPEFDVLMSVSAAGVMGGAMLFGAGIIMLVLVAARTITPPASSR